MNCLSLSRKSSHYISVIWQSSKTHSGVRFGISRISFGRRLEIAREIRALGQKLEYLEAGGSIAEKAEASMADAEIERVYLRCGLAGIEGLEIDGAPASAESLFAAGPEDLTREVLNAIKAAWGLSEEERKN
jgi:hypothetical protein